MLERSVYQPRARNGGVRGRGITEPEAVLDFAKVVRPSVLAIAVIMPSCGTSNSKKAWAKALKRRRT